MSILYKSQLIAAFQKELERTPDAIIKTKLDISTIFQNAICAADDEARKLLPSEKLNQLAQEILKIANH